MHTRAVCAKALQWCSEAFKIPKQKLQSPNLTLYLPLSRLRLRAHIVQALEPLDDQLQHLEQFGHVEVAAWCPDEKP